MEFLLLLTLVTAYFLWFTWPSVWTASENERIVSAFDVDEAYFLRAIKAGMKENTLKLPLVSYGSLYAYLVLLPLLAASKFTVVSEQLMVVTARIITLVFGVGTVALSFFLARRFFGSMAAWLTAFFLSVAPLQFLSLSAKARPDVPQMFFIVSGVYFCCRLAEGYRLRWLVLASASASLAFALKYSGVLLLPIILFIVAVQTIIEDNLKSRRDVKNKRRFLLNFGVALILVGSILNFSFVVGYPDSPSSKLIELATVSAVWVGGMLVLANVRFIGLLFSKNSKAGLFLMKAVVVYVSFALTFLLVSPEPTVREKALKGISFEYREVGFGYLFLVRDSGLKWFDILVSDSLLDGLLFCFALAGFAYFLLRVLRNPKKTLLSPECVMWLCVVLYLGILVLKVHMRANRFILPVLPFLIVLSSREIARVFVFILERFSKKSFGVLMAIILFSAVAFIELPRLDTDIKYRNGIASREKKSTAVAAGNWLTQRYPPSTRILYDYYSYVPQAFPDVDVMGTWGGTVELLNEFSPHVVVVNKKVSSRYSNLSNSAIYSRGEEEFKKHFEYYESLREGKLNYTKVKDFKDIKIYEKAV